MTKVLDEVLTANEAYAAAAFDGVLSISGVTEATRGTMILRSAVRGTCGALPRGPRYWRPQAAIHAGIRSEGAPPPAVLRGGNKVAANVL